jgi:hypothetical protein
MKHLSNFLSMSNKKEIFSALYKLSRDSFLCETGWFNSFSQKQSIDMLGVPLPWMTYSFIAFVEKRLCQQMEVFEYGCGNSTLWWAERVKSVISCEHDYNWYIKVKKKSPKNVTIYHFGNGQKDNYSSAIENSDIFFDIVIIDGENRIACAEKSIRFLKADGIVVWDNSDRIEYAEGFAFLYKNGFKQLEFHGTGPINEYRWSTSIFYRRNNCLDI